MIVRWECVCGCGAYVDAPHENTLWRHLHAPGCWCRGCVSLNPERRVEGQT